MLVLAGRAAAAVKGRPGRRLRGRVILRGGGVRSGGVLFGGVLRGHRVADHAFGVDGDGDGGDRGPIAQIVQPVQDQRIARRQSGGHHPGVLMRALFGQPHLHRLAVPGDKGGQLPRCGAAGGALRHQDGVDLADGQGDADELAGQDGAVGLGNCSRIGMVPVVADTAVPGLSTRPGWL